MVAKKKLKICLVSSEVAPLAKTGGLADVSAALSVYLHRAGHDVRLLMPLYDTIDRDSLDIVAVDFLQEIPITIGGRHGTFSIDTCKLPGHDVPVYLLRCPELYERGSVYTAHDDEHRRFILLCRAALEMCQHMSFAPDILHCNDWHTGLIPLYLKTTYAWDRLFAKTASVFTIHNIGYQGVISADHVRDLDLQGSEWALHQEDLAQGRINFLKTALLYADQLTTVSPTYAREIMHSEYGMGMEDVLRARSASVTGILNGIDVEEWNPQTDALIPANFSAADLAGKRQCKQALMEDLGLAGGLSRPLIGVVTRLTGQKGIDLMQKVLPQLLAQRDFALAVLGSGESRYEQFFQALQRSFPDRVCFYRGYNNRLAHWIEAGCDMFLMPSRYEPCGLNQMYSLRYGTVPIVRETGGLADSVDMFSPASGSGTGILFRDYNRQGLAWAINAGLDLYSDQSAWATAVANGMAKDFSWDRQGEQYVDLFRSVSGAK